MKETKEQPFTIDSSPKTESPERKTSIQSFGKNICLSKFPKFITHPLLSHFHTFVNLCVTEITEEQKVGLSSIKSLINQNCVHSQKWTLIKDFDGICYEHVLKYNADIIDVSELTFDTQELTGKITEAMEKGIWLVLNFEFMPVTLQEFIEKDIIPKQILEPKFVFNLMDGYNVFVETGVTTNHNFRLIFLTKSKQ